MGRVSQDVEKEKKKPDPSLGGGDVRLGFAKGQLVLTRDDSSEIGPALLKLIIPCMERK